MQRASGCLFGLAFGDALGAAAEFLTVEEIVRKFPPDGPRTLLGDPVPVTDDTQMALAVTAALAESAGNFTPDALEKAFRRHFIAWYHSPENNRAPGMTCLTACKNLDSNRVWTDATVPSSKGCGANMRVAPVGLLSRTAVTERTRAAIAQFQAALTHGHPTGLAAADLTARAIADLTAGVAAHKLPLRLRSYAEEQRFVYHEDWLGPLWQRPGADTPEQFIARGWDECLGVLDRLDAALRAPYRLRDPCLQTGAGWVAEEAFATGLLCFLLYPEAPLEAIHRAAVTSGDSDSIASLTGAFAGAHLGLNAWPQDWLERIEYVEQIARLGAGWDKDYQN